MKKPSNSITSVLIATMLIIGLINEPTNTVFGQSNARGKTMEQSPSGNSLDYIGQLGGNTYAVTVQGDYAYIGEGGRLTILNIVDPTLPTVIGKATPLPGMVADITISGNYAYIAAMEGGLRVIDIGNPADPFEVGYYDTPSSAHAVDLSGGYAYVADFDAGLRVVDISDPSNPFEVGFYDTLGESRGVDVSGEYAYLADGGTGLRIISISNPYNPIEVGNYDTPGTAYDVRVSGGYAYIADLHAMRVINISNPSNPIEQGVLGYGTPLVTALVYSSTEDYVYVAIGEYGLDLVDVSNKSNPHPHGTCNTPGNAVGVDVLSGYIYGADSNFGLRIVDVNDPDVPMEVGFYSGFGPTMAQNVTVAGGYAFVADDDNGLRIVDVNDVNDPVSVGVFDTPADTHDVVVSGTYAYIVDGSRGLRVIDVNNPSNPGEVGFYDTDGNAFGVAFSGGFIYVADQSNGLRVIDVSNPTNPLEVGYFIPPGSGADANGVAILGNYAYLAAGFAGLRVLDVSNPANPTEVGYFDTQSSAVDVAISGEYAYVADDEDGLRVIDVSNPTSPVEVGFYDTAGFADSVAVYDDYVYIADGDNGIRVIDVSNPTNPGEVGFYETPDYAFGVATSAGYVYVADREGGLLILQYGHLQNQPPVATDDSGPGFTTDEDTSFLTASVFSNDFDPDGDPLVLESYDDSGLLGVLIYIGEGSFAYSPDEHFEWLGNGDQATDIFTYVASDDVLTDTATVTLTITGANDPPIVEAGNSQNVDLGQQVSFEGAFTDPDWQGGTYEWDFGDGEILSGTLTPTHIYSESGIFTVTLTVSDDEGGIGSDWLLVSVSNEPPIVEAGNDIFGDEGRQIQFTGSFTDSDWTEGTIQWDFGDGVIATGTLTPTHAYGDNGAYTVTLTVTDADGVSGSDWLIASIGNLSPHLSGFPDVTIIVGGQLTITGVITDPGWLDTHEVFIGWEGSAPGPIGYVKLDAGVTDFLASFTYEESGVYQVWVQVRDDDMGAMTNYFTVIVLTTGPKVYLPIIKK